jgi:Ca2+-binding EF-hand superfamily protein
MKDIDEFNYANTFNSPYKSKDFKDTSVLKQYLRNNNAKSKSNPYFEQIISIVDTFFEIRTKAEEVNKSSNFFKVFNKEKELPISWEEISNVLNPQYSNTLNEPPTRLINIIAKEKFGTIQTLSTDMRKLLQRRREMIPISRVQQMDSACLRWLTKQPGYTTEQKAGNKQRVMGVVRFETYDTLENRVFKDFLRLCIAECRRYLEKFEKHYPNSQRIKEVKKLQSLAKITLEKPEMENIKRLYSYPKPNYVLQNNASYKTIWNLYKKLIQKSKLLETAWSNRQIVVAQYYQLSVMNSLFTMSKENNIYSYYFTNPTINLLPSKDGIFINNLGTSLKLLHYKSINKYVYLSPINKSGVITITIQNPNGIKKNTYCHFQYIPIIENELNEIIFKDRLNYNNCYYFVYKESEQIKINYGNRIDQKQVLTIENSDDAYEKIQNTMTKILLN